MTTESLDAHIKRPKILHRKAEFNYWSGNQYTNCCVTHIDIVEGISFRQHIANISRCILKLWDSTIRWLRVCIHRGFTSESIAKTKRWFYARVRWIFGSSHSNVYAVNFQLCCICNSFLWQFLQVKKLQLRWKLCMAVSAKWTRKRSENTWEKGFISTELCKHLVHVWWNMSKKMWFCGWYLHAHWKRIPWLI